MIEKGYWIVTGLLLSFLLSRGSWMGVGAIMGMLLYGAVLTAGLHPLAILLLVGPLTVFVFFNDVLNAIPFITMERGIFFSMLGLILLKDCFHKENRVKLVPVEVAMICFLFYTLLSLLTTLHDKTLLVWLSKSVSLYVQGYFMPMVSFMIARRMVWHERNIKFLFKLFVAAGAFLGVTAILQVFFGVSVFVPDYMTLIHHHETRAVGTFTNASEYGLVLSVLILLGVLMYTQAKGNALRLVLLGCLALMILGLIMSKTRAPWLGALISLTFVFIYDKRVRPMMIISTGFITTISMVVLPFLIDFKDYSSRLMEIVPILNRLGVWVASFNMMIQNPIFGIGFGRDSFIKALPEYLFSIGPISGRWAVALSLPHNEFITIAAHTGIVGGVLYLTIFWYLFQMLRNTYKDPSSSPFEKKTTLYMGGVLISFIINAFFVDIGWFNYFYILMFFLFGIVATFNQKNKTHELAQDPSRSNEIATSRSQP